VDLEFPQKIPALTKDVILLFFKTAQELLFNIVKHAEVREARVQVNLQKDRILMTVEDQGIGFNPEQAEGFGLSSIRERLSLMGGQMEIDSTSGQGSRFRIIAPISPFAIAKDKALSM
jgi:signal transduction histidine kinase